MIRLAKVRTIATFEFLAVVKRPGYLVITFGMPLFLAAYAAVVALPAYFASKSTHETSIYGVVDRPGLLALTEDTAPPEDGADEAAREVLEATGQGGGTVAAGLLRDPSLRFRPFEDEAVARGALASRGIKGYFVIPADYLATGSIEVYSPDTVSLSGEGARSALASLVRLRLVESRLDPEQAARAVRPIVRTERHAVTTAGEVKDGGEISSMVRIVVPVAFTVLFLMSVLMTSGYLLQGTATEKENKVVEVLMASANPDEILAGKLAGLGAAGVLQIVVWLSILFATGFGAVPFLLAAEVDAPWRALALALPYFVVAFLFFGSLMLGTGSLGSNLRESQQLAMIWSLTAALPLVMLSVLLTAPHGMLSRVLTWFPFTAGPIVVMRAALDPDYLAWWEAIGPIVVLMISTWLAIRLGARLFRIGLLSSGSRPSLREILRQARMEGQ
jgi:ABC-2 type transport system permease protein